MTEQEQTEFLKSIAIDYDTFQDWIETSTPQGWEFEDTRDVLSYMGYIQYHMYKKAFPDVTIEQLALVFFGDKEAQEREISRIRSQYAPTIN